MSQPGKQASVGFVKHAPGTMFLSKDEVRQQTAVMTAAQRDFRRKIESEHARVMGVIFDGNKESFGEPIAAAWSKARSLLCNQYECADAKQLEEKETQSPEIHEAVRARAREIFIADV